MIPSASNLAQEKHFVFLFGFVCGVCLFLFYCWQCFLQTKQMLTWILSTWEILSPSIALKSLNHPCLLPAELALQRLKRFGVCAAALICHFICQPGVSSVLFVHTCPCWPDGAGFGCHPKRCFRKARLCVVFQKPRSAASSAPLVKNSLT